MDKLSDPKHPIWTLANIVVGCIAINALLATILYFTASKFDWTEHRTIIFFALGSTASLVGVEGTLAGVRRFFSASKSCPAEPQQP